MYLITIVIYTKKRSLTIKTLNMSNSSNTVLGLLAGTAIGATLGVLFAPDKGVNTRQKIADEAVNAKEKIIDTASEVKEKVSNSLINKKDSLDNQLESVVSDMSYKTEDVITSLEKKLKDLKDKNKRLQKSA
jgi:gas vesicle protein